MNSDRWLAEPGAVRVRTAGAYIRLRGCWLFTIGTRMHKGRIPVVRVGGHREEGESGWQCAARETREETGLGITPLTPPATYAADWEHLDDLQAMARAPDLTPAWNWSRSPNRASCRGWPDEP